MARSLSIALALVLMARSSGTVLGQNEVREAIDEAVQNAVEAVEGNYAQFVDANEAPLATARQSRRRGRTTPHMHHYLLQPGFIRLATRFSTMA